MLLNQFFFLRLTRSVMLFACLFMGERALLGAGMEVLLLDSWTHVMVCFALTQLPLRQVLASLPTGKGAIRAHGW